jgi:hypothetical protein
MLGTAAAYATVERAAGPTATVTTRHTPGRVDDHLEPVRLQRVYRVPFAQLSGAGGR